MQLDGRQVVLTGAASGIGRALLDRLAAYNVRVLAVDQDAVGLGAPRQQGKMEVIPHGCDLGEAQAVDGVFEHALQALGGVDLYIANAGFAYYEKIETPDWEHIERIFRVNVFSSLYALEKMRALNLGRPFKVVITASAMGFLGVPGYALYSSSKAALLRFAEAYRYELEDRRSLALVYPIATRTHFFNTAARHPAPTPWPSQTAEQVARAILKGILRDQMEIFPSTFFRIFRWMPWLHGLEKWIEAQRLEKWARQVCQNG